MNKRESGARSFFTLGDATFVVEGSGAASPATLPALPLDAPDASFARALSSLDASLLWCLHEERAQADVRALEGVFARVPLFSPDGKAPLAPAAAVRLAATIDEHAASRGESHAKKRTKKKRALTIALVGDLELAAIALAARGHACTLVVDEDGPFVSLARAAGVDVVVYAMRDALPTSLHAAFDLVLLDLAAQGDGYVQMMARALALTDEGGLVGVVSHPRLRDKAMPALVEVLPVDDEPTLFVDFLPRVLPGPVKMGEHWDLFVLERDDEPLPLAADEPCSAARARDLDPDLHVMLAEEVHGLSRPLDDDDVARVLAHVERAGFAPLSVTRQDSGPMMRAHLALDDGGFVDFSAHRDHGLVTFCLGGYMPRRFVALGLAIVAALPSWQH